MSRTFLTTVTRSRAIDRIRSRSSNLKFLQRWSQTMSSENSSAILLMQNLPVLPPGKSYQLWCVVNGKKIASGNFNSNPQKKVFVKVPFSVTSDISALAVTVEVSPNPPMPKGPMVMTSSL
jgi:hypothetical protein